MSHVCAPPWRLRVTTKSFVRKTKIKAPVLPQKGTIPKKRPCIESEDITSMDAKGAASSAMTVEMFKMEGKVCTLQLQLTGSTQLVAEAFHRAAQSGFEHIEWPEALRHLHDKVDVNEASFLPLQQHAGVRPPPPPIPALKILQPPPAPLRAPAVTPGPPPAPRGPVRQEGQRVDGLHLCKIPKASKTSTVMSHGNDFCPCCRVAKTGSGGFYDELLANDKAHNPFHRARIFNETGYLWTGIPEGRVSYCEKFAADQVEPYNKDTWTSSKWQSLADTFVFEAGTPQMSEQLQYGIMMALNNERSTVYRWRATSKNGNIIAMQCEVCKCIFHYEWYKNTQSCDKKEAMWWALAFLFAWPLGCDVAGEEPSPP